MEKIKLTTEITDEILKKVQVYVKEKLAKTTGAECAAMCANIESQARTIVSELIAERQKYDRPWNAAVTKQLYIKKRNDNYVVEVDDNSPYAKVYVDLSSYIYVPYNDRWRFDQRVTGVLGQSYLENVLNSLESLRKTEDKLIDCYSSIIYSYRFAHTLLSDYPEFVSFMPDYISEQIYVSPKIQASKLIRLFESGELHKIAV